MKILVTGGAGYIGSHTVVELVAAGHEPVIVDNFSNSHPEVLTRLAEITGRKIEFHEVDVAGEDGMRVVFDQVRPAAVIHFAGLKAVGESVDEPLRYYQNNILATLTVGRLMVEFGVKQMIFSSSATVYGDPAQVPVREDAPLMPTNPYGWTKLMSEQILQDAARADSSWQVTLLRYFNPVGAHESGLIGEDPQGKPNNLMPYVAKVAGGVLDELPIFGNDYATTDGTGVRDYIHVVDLAKAHVKALEHRIRKPGVRVFNLGTGVGYSVLDMVQAYENVSSCKVKYKVVGRRLGDVAVCYADPSLAERELDWKAEKTLDEMCADTWRWQSKNPDGYA